MDKQLIEARKAVEVGNFAEAEEKYQQIITQTPSSTPALAQTLQAQEAAILELGKVYQQQQQAQKLKQLIDDSRKVWGQFAKSKAAKVVKTLIENFDTIKDALVVQISATEDLIQWAIEAKLLFLRQTLQLKLAELFYAKGQYNDGLTLLLQLLSEYKKLDDKSSLIEVQLLELKILHALRNIPKLKAALTSARTLANSIFCPTLLQAELDCQLGILHAEDKDYNTAFSYFFESFEGFNLQDNEKLVAVLKYMLLTKIMLNKIDEVNQILNNKNVKKYQLLDIDAMKAISTAYQNRSLKEFEQLLATYSNELTKDEIIKNHFNALYDNLLEQNILKIIELYSVVELTHISKVIGLNLQQIEGKLSQMILDKVFYGVLDQGNGWLIIYDEPVQDKGYESALDLVKNLNNTVDLLYEKASSLN